MLPIDVCDLLIQRKLLVLLVLPQQYHDKWTTSKRTAASEEATDLCMKRTKGEQKRGVVHAHINADACVL